MKMLKRTRQSTSTLNNSKASGSKVFQRVTVIAIFMFCCALFPRQFLQCYSLMSNAIREVPPGEAVFNLEKFGQIFNHDTLELKQCVSNSQDTLQKTLLM